MLSATRISLTEYHDKEKYTVNNEDHEYELNNLVKNDIFCTTFLYFRYICITRTEICLLHKEKNISLK